MEQKRTVWIVLASGIFLCVVLGAAVILYSAEAKKNTTALAARDAGLIWMSPEEAAKKPQNAVDTSLPPPPAPSQPATTPAANQGVADVAGASDANRISQSDSVTVISTGKTSVYNMGETTTSTIDLSDLNNNASSANNVAALNEAAENAMTETGKVYRNVESEELPSKATSSAAKSESASASAVGSTKKTEASPAPAKSASSAPAKKESRFWVQAGSFATTKYADEARSELETNKIPCEVFTFSDKDGNLRYRVRVGPYISKSEAEYWKQKIDTIPLFSKSGSYVVSSTL